MVTKEFSIDSFTSLCNSMGHFTLTIVTVIHSIIFFHLLQGTSYTINPGKQPVVDRKRFILKPVAVLQSEESKYQTDIK